MQKGGLSDNGPSEYSTTKKNLLLYPSTCLGRVFCSAHVSLGRCAHTTAATTWLGLILGFLALACSPPGTRGGNEIRMKPSDSRPNAWEKSGCGEFAGSP
ncbi:hypothetical protein GRJ2_000892600 [Grus japonensis]|uniref:Uncharacterized protein n=1 Tax=Grus japonensis TaxID=30415 RepID=A0ABC9WFQ8_GRUJA